MSLSLRISRRLLRREESPASTAHSQKSLSMSQTSDTNPLSQRRRKVLEESANQDKRGEKDVLITKAPTNLEEVIEVAVEATEVVTVLVDTTIMKNVLNNRRRDSIDPATIITSQEMNQKMNNQESRESRESQENQESKESQEENIEVEDIIMMIQRTDQFTVGDTEVEIVQDTMTIPKSEALTIEAEVVSVEILNLVLLEATIKASEETEVAEAVSEEETEKIDPSEVITEVAIVKVATEVASEETVEASEVEIVRTSEEIVKTSEEIAKKVATEVAEVVSEEAIAKM